jgi:hypothetical protein
MLTRKKKQLMTNRPLFLRQIQRNSRLAGFLNPTELDGAYEVAHN